MRATVARSLYEEFVQEPMQTWSTFTPARLLTGTTLPGEWGAAARGSSAPKSISTSIAYSASGSAASACQSASRPCERR